MGVDNTTIEPPGIYGLLSTLKFSDSGATSSKFCALCANFQISSAAEEPEEGTLLMFHIANHEIRQEYKDFYPFFSGFQRREKKGCAFCSFITKSLRVELPKRAKRLRPGRRPIRIVLSASMFEQVEHGSALAMYRDRGPHTLKIQVLHEEYGETSEILSYDVTFQTSSEPTVTIQKPLSDSNITNISRWLSDCDTKHSSCQAALTDYAPTRLLAVQEDLLRLVTGKISSPRYVALSYCWGQTRKKGTLTTTSNIGARLKGFAIDELSNTLQDAIQTARAFGINYVWIDAICIIQDDLDDWAREASRMGDIYKHAYFTIAPTTSVSSVDGFLQDRDPCFKASFGFHFEELQSMRARPKTNASGTIHFRYPPERTILDDLSECKWSKRGWTLQEKLLSTRILYFTKEVLYYECVTTQKAENSEYRLPERLRLPALFANSSSFKPVDSDHQYSEHLSSWYKIVMAYTERSLSHARDKLPALQGLAEVYQGVIKNDYIYGLWKSDLHMGLLWHGGIKRYQREYRAPSWSWASLDGSVFWDESSFTPGWRSLMSDLNASAHQHCTHCEETMGARLEVTAPLAPLKDVLLAYYRREDEDFNDQDFNDEDFRELEHWNPYEDLGLFMTDLEGDMPICLDGTEMMLVAEKDETQNIQAIIIQSFGSANHFKRIGWFIHKDTSGEMTEHQWSDRYFDDIRKVFKVGKRVLV